MSYGTGRFSNLEAPDPTLSYVARRRIRHHDLVFEPGDPISAEQVGHRSLVKYIRARMVDFPVKPGDAVPPEAGAVLLQEPRASEPTGAGLDDLQQGVAGPEDAANEVVIRSTPGQPISDKARAIARDIDARMDARMVRHARSGDAFEGDAPVLIEKPAPAPSDGPTDTSSMTKAELTSLIDERGLQVDKRLPLGAMRAKVAAALAG